MLNKNNTILVQAKNRIGKSEMTQNGPFQIYLCGFGDFGLVWTLARWSDAGPQKSDLLGPGSGSPHFLVNFLIKNGYFDLFLGSGALGKSKELKNDLLKVIFGIRSGGSSR